MEIDIENKIIQSLIEYIFRLEKRIMIVSIDDQDFGKTFTIKPEDIISIEEDLLTDEDNCYIIWWKQYNELEGKYITNSNHFTNFGFTN